METDGKGKIIVEYIRKHPLDSDVTYVAIDTSTRPYSVFGLFLANIITSVNRVELPGHLGEIINVKRDVADMFYNFRKK
jgi:hypothetical protein